jgi:hypothetical protein
MDAGAGAPTRDELRAQLIRTGIAGDVATRRENNLDHYRSLAIRDPHYLLGLTIAPHWRFPDILALMAKSAGVVADPAHREGQDTIDPDRTIDATEAMAARIATALSRPAPRLLFATGHPTGLLTVHLALARLAVAHGATLLTPAEGWTYRSGGWGRGRRIHYLDGVAMLDDGGALVHTHDADPMKAMLAELTGSSGEPGDGALPDLVVADHGWAGAAGEAGVETVGFADSNDPGLFVGEAEGKIAVAVPLDDNVHPKYYRPLTDYLIACVLRDL